jgi:hypothetical protein
MLASKSTSAKCQYQTLPMFGAAPPRQAEQSRESYKPEPLHRKVLAADPSAQSGSCHKRLVICNGADSTLIPESRSPWCVANDCIPREHAINGREKCWFISPHWDRKPGSYMRLGLGSTVRARPKSELEMGMLTR